MAIDQGTIDNAGIGAAPPPPPPSPASVPAPSSVPSPAGIAGIRQHQAELGQQLQATQQEQERISQEKTQALEPIRSQLLEEAKKTPGEAPKEELAPSFQRPTVDPKEFHDSFGVLMAATMLVGAASRAPFFGTMNAMTGAMNGFMTGDKNLVDEAMKEYDKNMAAIKERNAAKRREFDDAWNKHSNNLGALRTQLEIIAAKYDDPAMLQAAKAKTITDAMKAGDVNLRHMEQMQMQMDKLRYQMEKGGAQMGKKGGVQESEARTMAWDYLIRGHNPPAAGGAYQSAMKEVHKIAQELGVPDDQLITASAEVKTMLSGRRAIESRVQNLERAENQLNLEIPVMQDAMKKVSGSSIPIAQRGMITVLRSAGDPTITTLDQAASTVMNEFEGIVTGNPGTLNVADVEHAKETYKQIQTVQQMQAWIDGAKRIIANAKKANETTRDEFTQNIRRTIGFHTEAAAGAPMSFGTEAEAEAAEKSGKLKKGSKVTIGGVSGTWQ